MYIFYCLFQVDSYDLCSLPKPESVARIKDKSVVTFTVLRGGGPLLEHTSATQGKHPEHIYDEILYAELNPFADENSPPPCVSMSQKEWGLSQDSQLSASRNTHRLLHPSDGSRSRINRPTSPMADNIYKSPLPLHQVDAPKVIYSERGSRDSGLSSGSPSESPPPIPNLGHPAASARHPAHPLPVAPLALSRDIDARHSYRTEREMARGYSKQKRLQICADHADRRGGVQFQYRGLKSCRIDGDYEVEVSNGGCRVV